MANQSFISALAHGAIGFVSNLISQALHPFTIINRIRSAYRGMNMGEVSQVYHLGVQAYSAGQEIGATVGSGLAQLNDIPINSQLFGGQQTTNRFRFQTRVIYNIPGEQNNRYTTINILSPSNLSLADLQAIAEQRFAQLVGAGDSPRIKTGGQPVVVQDVSILNVERQY